MDMQAYREAIASIESAGSGDYSAVGPTNERLGRALGRYQIMEANIPQWSREALGYEVSPEDFLRNPQIQDAIFDNKFGSYVQRFGPEGAAQAWFAGPGGVGKLGRKDVLGTSVADYTGKFAGALGRAEPTTRPGEPGYRGTPPFNPISGPERAPMGQDGGFGQPQNALAQREQPRRAANLLDARQFQREMRPVNRLAFT